MSAERFPLAQENEKQFSAVRRRSVYLTACGALALMATLTGCEDSNPAPTTPSNYSLDRDNDGIINTFDRKPDIADPFDVDNDGIPNSSDTLFPYDPLNGASAPNPPLDQVTPTPVVPNAPQSCIRYAKPDTDGDGIPDYCDPSYGGLKDSDDDGVADRLDPAPHTADRDFDGLLDGQDSQPDVNQKKEQEQRDQAKRDAERLEEKRQEERRQREKYGY